MEALRDEVFVGPDGTKRLRAEAEEAMEDAVVQGALTEGEVTDLMPEGVELVTWWS